MDTLTKRKRRHGEVVRGDCERASEGGLQSRFKLWTAIWRKIGKGPGSWFTGWLRNLVLQTEVLCLSAVHLRQSRHPIDDVCVPAVRVVGEREVLNVTSGERRERLEGTVEAVEKSELRKFADDIEGLNRATVHTEGHERHSRKRGQVFNR